MQIENLVCRIEEYLNKNFLAEMRNKASGINDNIAHNTETKKDSTGFAFALDSVGSKEEGNDEGHNNCG